MIPADVSLQVGELSASQSLFQSTAFLKLFSSLAGSRFGKSPLFMFPSVISHQNQESGGLQT